MYNGLYIYRQWDRVFAFPLAVVLWCNLLVAIPYWCVTVVLRCGFFYLAAHADYDEEEDDQEAWNILAYHSSCCFVLMTVFILIHDLGMEDT